MVGKTALLKRIAYDSRRFTWGPVDAVVSLTGDLGYVFGDAQAVRRNANVGPTTSSYLRIWRKTAAGDRRIVLDLAIPAPAEPEKKQAG
jgi:hypothetical protein